MKPGDFPGLQNQWLGDPERWVRFPSASANFTCGLMPLIARPAAAGVSWVAGEAQLLQVRRESAARGHPSRS